MLHGNNITVGKHLFTQKPLTQSTAGCQSFYMAYITVTMSMAQRPVQFAKPVIKKSLTFIKFNLMQCLRCSNADMGIRRKSNANVQSD